MKASRLTAPRQVRDEPRARRVSPERASAARTGSVAPLAPVARMVRAPPSAPMPDAVDRILRTEGAPLPSGLRGDMERGFGESFGDIRIHAGGSAAVAAQAVRAQAFAHGRHLVFGQGSFDPLSGAGRALLAHELSHVVQQRRGGAAPDAGRSAGLERASDRAADAVLGGKAGVTVEGASAPGIARQAIIAPPTYADVKIQRRGPAEGVLIVEGVPLFTYKGDIRRADNVLQVDAFKDGDTLRIEIGPNNNADLRILDAGVAQLSRSGWGKIVINQAYRKVSYGELSLEQPPATLDFTTLPIEPARPKPAARKPAPKPKAPAPDKVPDQPSSPAQSAPVSETPIQTEGQQAPTPDTDLNAAAMKEINDELAAVEPLAVKLADDAPDKLDDHALNEYLNVQKRLAADEKILREFLPVSRDHNHEVQQALDRIVELRKLLDPAAAAAVKWHDDNPMGESLGMMHERVGTDLAGEGLEAYDKGGLHYVSGTAYMAGALGIAFLDSAEKLFTFGFHDTATEVAKAYARGDLSWNEGKDILWSAGARAVIIAAVTRGAGMLGSRLGAGTAEAIGLSARGTSFAVTRGIVAGTLESTAMLTTQAATTKLGESKFTSPEAKAIWNKGMPSGTDWAIAIPMGMLFGAGGSFAEMQAANAKLIGTTVDTPMGRMTVEAVTGEGNIVLKPLGGRSVPPPPKPPAPELVMVYDPAEGAWVRQGTSRAAPPARELSLSTGADPPPVSSRNAVIDVDLAPTIAPGTPPKLTAPPRIKALTAGKAPSPAAPKQPAVIDVIAEPVTVAETPAAPSIAEPIQQPAVRATVEPDLARPTASPKQAVRAAPATDMATGQVSSLQSAAVTAGGKAEYARNVVDLAREDVAAAEAAYKAARTKANKAALDTAKGALKSFENELKPLAKDEAAAGTALREAEAARDRIAQLEERIADLDQQRHDALFPVDRFRSEKWRGSGRQEGIRPSRGDPGGKEFWALEDGRTAALKALQSEKVNFGRSINDMVERATPGAAGRAPALANARKVGLDPVDGVPIDVTTGRPMAADAAWETDHIISRYRIKNDPRFIRLTPAQQKAMLLDIPENYLPLTESANASKGSRTIDEWVAANSKDSPIPPDMADKLRAAEKLARDAIEARFNLYLEK